MDKQKIARELVKLAEELVAGRKTKRQAAKKKFLVEVRRESWAFSEFTVEAKNEREAERKALQEAADYGGWSEGDAEYEVESVEEWM